MKLVGVKNVDYVSKKTGNPVHGYEFFVSYPSSKMILGDNVLKKFVSESAVERSGGLPTEAGLDIQLNCNPFGNIDSYIVG